MTATKTLVSHLFSPPEGIMLTAECDIIFTKTCLFSFSLRKELLRMNLLFTKYEQCLHKLRLTKEEKEMHSNEIVTLSSLGPFLISFLNVLLKLVFFWDRHFIMLCLIYLRFFLVAIGYKI